MRNVTLKALRAREGISQKLMAEKLDISLQSYNQKENGIRGFTEKEINTILQLFGGSYEQIFFAPEVRANKTDSLLSCITKRFSRGK